MPKGELIERAFKTISLFNRGPVTTKMVMDSLDIKNATNARRWIRIASLSLPIIEDESSHPKRKVWRLME